MIREFTDSIYGLLCALVSLLIFWAFLIFPGQAWAELEYSSAEPMTTQFVVVVDDSGSMRVRTRDGPAADPDRLAIFATRSLLSLLDDRDEVTVVRLNGPADGESLIPIAELAENRSLLEESLSLDGVMAQYPGRVTPCRQALGAVARELNEAYRPNVNQVVLFLTDGECNDGNLNPAQWLRTVESHGDEAFQFYLLRWRGRVYSQYLVDLANQTGGTVSIVGAEDPTDLLRPFASVMSRAQGYESHLLTPSDSVLPTHSGARRVRLLAVAPDAGQDLSFQISARGDGEQPEQIGAQSSGLHQYEDGGRYRYAALEYRPGTTPVSVSVDGAGGDWQVVALPEYRLQVDTSLHRGRCSEQGDEITFSEVGGSICVRLTLVNEDGDPVTSDVVGRTVEASVGYREPGKDRRALPANQVGDQPVFQIERANLEEGDHIFEPTIVLHGSQGGRASIRGAARSVQVSTRRVEATPARLELGDLLPGTEHYFEVTIDGNFPSTRARLVAEGRDRLPECLSFALNGVEEGEGQTVSAGQTYTVEVHVAPYCGPSNDEFSLDTALRLQFDRSSQSAPIPALVLPIRGSLIHELRSPARLETSIDAGDDRDLRLRLGGNHQRDVSFIALLPAEDERPNWPSRHLSLALIDEDGNRVATNRDGSAEATINLPTVTDDEDAPVLTVRAESGPCCNGGQFETQLLLVPAEGTRSSLRVPMMITVEEAPLWQCWGATILRALLALLLLLLAAYIINMWRSSHFLDRDSLADRLVPLQWDDFGEARPRNEAARDVRAMVRRSLSLVERAKAWLKANPLVFGLPGREYHETVELVLNSSPNVQRSRLRVVPERDFAAQLRNRPRRGLARVYATARGGISFFAVPAEENRIGTFEMQRGFDDFDDGEAFEPKLENLRRRTEFLAIHSDREPDGMAGWRVG